MPELESHRFIGTIADRSGRVLGEARMWGTGERGPDGTWSGWLRAADIGGRLPPGRYTVTAGEGWRGEFEVADGPVSRVFETDLIAVIGVGPPRWPERSTGVEGRAGRPPLVSTPWQGAQGIPPYKQEGDDRPGARRPRSRTRASQGSSDR